MLVELSYADWKAVTLARSIAPQSFAYRSAKRVVSFDGPLTFVCDIDLGSSEETDYVAEFSTKENKQLVGRDSLGQPLPQTTVHSVPFIGSKNILVNGITKKLFARNTGIQATLTAGINAVDYVATFPWVKIVGVEVIGGETLDTASLKVFDNSSGTYSGVPSALLNQFGYSVNVAKDFYERLAQFDADLYAGMVLRFDYNSVSAKTVGINILMNEVK